MHETKRFTRLLSRVALIALVFSLCVSLTPALAASNMAASDGKPREEAPAKININEVMFNVRASTSLRTKEMVRLADNPVGFNYEGTFILAIPAVKIIEKIGMGDDTEGLDVGYSTYVGTIDNIWYGVEEDIAILDKKNQDYLQGTNRIFNLAGAFPFEAIPPGNFAKLSKADQTADGVKCDEYAWKKGKDEYTMCIQRESALPVVLNAKVRDLIFELHYSNYDDPENVFILPRESELAYFVPDAFMSLLSLKNFEYKIVYGTKTAKGLQIESAIQGLFIQEARSWQASEWTKTDKTTGVPAQRYVQIGRQRWSAPGDKTKPFKPAPLLNPRAVINPTDKFTRATPFLMWLMMIDEKQFKGEAQIVDDTVKFEGESAIKYKVGENKKKPDDYIEIVVLKDSGVPVHVDYHTTSGGRKNVITWDIISMDKTGVKIEAPATPAKK